MNKQYRYCFKEKKLICISSGHENSPIESIDIDQISFGGDNVKVVTKTAAAYTDFDEIFSPFPVQAGIIEFNTIELSSFDRVIEGGFYST